MTITFSKYLKLLHMIWANFLRSLEEILPDVSTHIISVPIPSPFASYEYSPGNVRLKLI
jgi:uracil DNA glycosylase